MRANIQQIFTNFNGIMKPEAQVPSEKFWHIRKLERFLKVWAPSGGLVRLTENSTNILKY